jgi:hypothetical protein
MKNLIAMLDLIDVKILFEFTRMSKKVDISIHPKSVKLDLSPVKSLMDQSHI